MPRWSDGPMVSLDDGAMVSWDDEAMDDAAMDDGAMDAATSTWRVSGAAMVDGRHDLVEGCRDGCAQIGSESRTNLGGSTILENGKSKMPNCWRSPFFPFAKWF